MMRKNFLYEMGLDPIWRRRSLDTTQKTPEISPELSESTHSIKTEVEMTGAPGPQARNTAISQMDWPQLEQAIVDCRACKLCEQRRQTVAGVGDKTPEWLFVGEGPGAEEDAKGEPFVGQAGKLLDNQLTAIGLKRGNKVFIANIVKCRPPGNRVPDSEEIACCLPFLERQIALLKPRLIIALGATAVQGLLREKHSIASLRGKRFDYNSIPLIVSYHPAYLLRNLPDKSKAWADLCFARSQLNI